MAKNKSGGSVGGFVFNFFNVGFTVVMFLLPTAGLVYWYLYIRDDGGGVAQKPPVVVRELPRETERPKPMREKPKAQSATEPMTSGFFHTPSSSANESAGVSQTVAAPPTQPTRQAYELRTWKDPSGKFSIEARFYSVAGEQVKLVTSDDTRLDVEIAKLSEEDKEYVRKIFREKGIQPRF